MAVDVSKDILSEKSRASMSVALFGHDINQPTNQKLQLRDVTHTIDTLPIELEWMVREDCNIYNFICMSCVLSDEVEEHTDEDLVPHLIHAKVPGYYIKPPIETSVYYMDVCEDMRGGEYVCGDIVVRPESNMCITFPSQSSHSVREVTFTSKPRLTVVCEKYKILPVVERYINFPWYRE